MSNDYNFETLKQADVVRSVRRQGPAHYKFEIHSVKALKKSMGKDEAIVSPEFTIGQHTWTMSVCLNGNQFLALYVTKISDSNDSTTVKISLRFFIYDFKAEQYLMIQDSSLKEFNSSNNKCGIPKALNLADFEDPRFIHSDSCILGVEIFYHNPTGLGSSLTPWKEGISQRTHTWMSGKIEKLHHLTNSPKFKLLGMHWELHIYPQGYGSAKGQSLSLFLLLKDDSIIDHRRKLFARFELCLKNISSKRNITKTITCWFAHNNGLSYGFGDFIGLNILHDSSQGYLVNGCLSLEVTIKDLFVIAIDQLSE